MSSYNPFPINDRTVDFVDVMKKIGQGGESPNAQRDGDKVYVTIGEHHRLITATGARGRFEKKISLEQLVEIFNEIITNPAADKLNESELESVIKGMETLKSRLKNKKLSPSEKFKKIILHAFGYQDKYDCAVEKISQLAKGLKIELLNFKIERLKEEKTRIEGIESENLLQIFKKRAPNLTPDKMKENQQAIGKIDQSIENLRKKIQLLEKGEGRLEISKKPVEFSFISPPVDESERRILRVIANRLGPSPEGKTENYAQYLRTLIFGFSIGQKKNIKSLDRQMSFKVEDLEKMLEGGNSINNMFYVANYLDAFLARQKLEPTEDPQYIKALENLQADLKRSLPIAFSNYTLTCRLRQGAYVDAKDFRQPISNIEGTLKQIQVGEKLIIPIQTPKHATLLVFEKMKNGKIQPIFYNTGEGVSRHVTTNLSVKALSDHLNTFADRYPVSKIYEPLDVDQGMEQFEEGIMKLLNINNNTGMDEVYSSLEAALGKGRSGKPKRVQINGVCSFQSLSEVFKDTLGSKQHYLRFKRGLLRSIQEEFKEVTRAIEPVMEENEDMMPVYTLHQNLLGDNEAEINRCDRLLREMEESRSAPRTARVHPSSF